MFDTNMIDNFSAGGHRDTVALFTAFTLHLFDPRPPSHTSLRRLSHPLRLQPGHQVLELPRQLSRVKVHRHPHGCDRSSLAGMDYGGSHSA